MLLPVCHFLCTTSLTCLPVSSHIFHFTSAPHHLNSSPILCFNIFDTNSIPIAPHPQHTTQLNMPFKWDADSERKLLLYIVKHCDVRPGPETFNGVAAVLGIGVNSSACRSVLDRGGPTLLLKLSCRLGCMLTPRSTSANTHSLPVKDSTNSSASPSSS